MPRLLRPALALAVCLAAACNARNEDPPACDVADAGAVELEPADAATPPSHEVSSLAVSAGKTSVLVTYSVDCARCTAGADPAAKSVEVTTRVFNPLAESSQSAATAVGDPVEVPEGKPRGAVLAASASGDAHLALVERPDGSLRLGGMLPGGAVISAAVSAGARTTPNTSFGTMVRAGMLAAVAQDTGWVLVTAADGTLQAVRLASGKVTDTVAAPAGATSAALAVVNDKPAFAFTTGALDADGDVQVLLPGSQAVTATMKGVPEAMWTDGVAFRVIIKSADGQLGIWDGKTVYGGPRIDEAACGAVAFDAGGSVYVLHAGPKSIVLYGEGGPAGMHPVASLPSGFAINEQGIKVDFAINEQGIKRPEFGINEQGVRRCGLAVTGDGQLAAVVSSVDPAAAAGDEGRPTLVETFLVDRETGALKLHTGHDTSKNTVRNMR